MLLYYVAVILGSISFSTVFTMVSAIASKAGNGGMLMAILSFPIIIPVLDPLLIKLAKNAVDGLPWENSYDEIAMLAGGECADGGNLFIVISLPLEGLKE